MAEFDNEAANLDLFQEIFSPRPTRDHETADAVSRTLINNVVDSNVNKHSHIGNFLKSTTVANNIDNGLLSQTDVTDDLITESIAKEVQDSIKLNNIENLKKIELACSTPVNNTDNKIDNTDDGGDDGIGHNNVVNGSTNAELQSDEKTCGKQKRGISFPKDTFISGYFEPPDPWKNAPSWTTDELVSAYKKSCELHGAKPIAKLVQQLQTYSPGRQEELLSLKGEKLDQKQCECLEEVLRRVQFKLLDLEASHLDDECAVAVFDMIEYYESACQLNISFNKNIQARGWQACSRLVRRTPNLTYLDMRSCDLNDRNIPIFGRALKLGCHLTILHMESMNLSGRPLVILVAALKMNETLQELFLAENKLMPTDGVQLGNLLRYNRKLSLLDLRNNHLQDVGTSHISDGLMEQGKGPGLQTLVLWNNAINYQAMPALGRALAANESLGTLNIGHNTLTNEGVHLLKDGLLKTNSLLRLGLQGTRITDEGAVALAEYIADSTILLRIDLRDNDIKTGGLMALSHAMRVNSSVTRIDLDKEPKKESSMKDYAEQQSHLLRDIYTFQQRNIQAAVNKEEQERAKIEEQLNASSVGCQVEAGDEQVAGTLPANSSTESFTLFEKEKEEEEVKNHDVKQEKDKKDAENAKAKSIGERLRESHSQFVENEPDDVDSSISEEDVKNRQRPHVLFPYFGLPPQASLDSPLPTSNESPLVSILSEPVYIPPPLPQPIPPSQKGLLTLSMGSAPGEMILSPQYFPKQIARKIFSVSRVSEDSSCRPLSSSPIPPNPLSASFDPLNVSPIPLVPVPSSSILQSSSSPVLIPQSTLGVSQHSRAALQTSVSPTSSLFQDLAEETVRHLVSPIIDISVKSLLAQNIEHNLASDNIAPKSNITVIASESSGTSVKLSSSSSSEQATLDETLFDNFESSLLDTENNKASIVFRENLYETNLVSENVVVISHEQTADTETDGEGAMQQEPLIPENTTEQSCLKNSLTESHSSEGIDLWGYSDDSEYKNDLSTQTKVRDVKTEVPEADTSIQNTGHFCDTQNPDSSYFSIEENIESAANYSDLDSHMAAYLNKGAGDDAMQGKGILEKEELQQFRQHHAADIFSQNFLVELSDKEKYSSSTVTDINTENELASACLNNSNSPSLLQAEDTKEVSAIKHNNNSEFNSFESGCKHSLSSFEDLSELDIGANEHEKDMQANASGLSLKAYDVNLENDCADSLTDTYNSNIENIDIENMDFNLDEEPWLAVGAENDSNGTEKSKESLPQPDFFTTLSMNGLTQELASALTSLDGSTTSFGNEDDNLDLRPHDEFEKELDAMLAIVQSELPWPLKDS